MSIPALINCYAMCFI